MVDEQLAGPVRGQRVGAGQRERQRQVEGRAFGVEGDQRQRVGVSEIRRRPHHQPASGRTVDDRGGEAGGGELGEAARAGAGGHLEQSAVVADQHPAVAVESEVAVAGDGGDRSVGGDRADQVEALVRYVEEAVRRQDVQRQHTGVQRRPSFTGTPSGDDLQRTDVEQVGGGRRGAAETCDQRRCRQRTGEAEPAHVTPACRGNAPYSESHRPPAEKQPVPPGTGNHP